MLAGLLRLKHFIDAEWRSLTALQPSDRGWQMPLVSALCTSLPLVAGAAAGRMDMGLAGCIGGLAFLHMPAEPDRRSPLVLLLCGLGMVLSYTLGALCHLHELPPVPALVLITIIASVLCRRYRPGPPGSLFFVMTGSIGAYSPMHEGTLGAHVLALTLGVLLACALGYPYARYAQRRRGRPPAPVLRPDFQGALYDGLVIGACVGASLVLAAAFALERPYWVPVSCLAVLQGVSLRAVWARQIHRIVGTAVGLCVTWWLLMLPPEEWLLCAQVAVLIFVIEFIITRHYGLAVIFITPVTILLAEMGRLGAIDVDAIMHARFIDAALGAMVGLAGGVCIYHARVRAVLSAPVAALLR